MSRPARDYLVGLNLIPELTPRRMAVLLDRFASPEEMWHAPVGAIAALPGFASAADRIAGGRDERALDRELERAKREGIRIVTVLDPEYPVPLREIEAPPTVLYLRGEGSLDTTRTIALVGTRRSSRYGRAVAERLGEDLCRVGLIVVSGLAVGIDAAAHRGALRGGGTTVAVLGSGLLKLYPAGHHSLAREIAQRGLLVSEYPLETPPAKWTFPQRNRVISGLSRGVVVVEAPERSGALITARLGPGTGAGGVRRAGERDEPRERRHEPADPGRGEARGERCRTSFPSSQTSLRSSGRRASTRKSRPRRSALRRGACTISSALNRFTWTISLPAGSFPQRRRRTPFSFSKWRTSFRRPRGGATSEVLRGDPP